MHQARVMRSIAHAPLRVVSFANDFQRDTPEHAIAPLDVRLDDEPLSDAVRAGDRRHALASASDSALQGPWYRTGAVGSPTARCDRDELRAIQVTERARIHRVEQHEMEALASVLQILNGAEHLAVERVPGMAASLVSRSSERAICHHDDVLDV